jgi:hypothetical protein
MSITHSFIVPADLKLSLDRIYVDTSPSNSIIKVYPWLGGTSNAGLDRSWVIRAEIRLNHYISTEKVFMEAQSLKSSQIFLFVDVHARMLSLNLRALTVSET